MNIKIKSLLKNMLLTSCAAILLMSNNVSASNYELKGYKFLNETADEIGKDISIDGDGNIYILAYTDAGDSVLLKYSPAGTLIWAKRYNRYAEGIVLHAMELGNSALYITGYGSNSGGTSCLTAAYDFSGALLWYRYFDQPLNPTMNEQCTDIALDHNENIIVGGTLSDFTVAPVVIKYDSVGNYIAHTTIGVGIDEHVEKLSIDGYNKIYALIATNFVGQEKVVRLTPELARDDLLFFNTIYPNSIEADNAGNLHVAGYRDYTLRMIKYDSSGNEVCMCDLDGGAYNAYSFNDVAVNSDGDVLLTGGGSYYNSDIVTVKYDANCALASNVMVFDGNYHDNSSGITLDAADNIYISGSSVRSVELPFYKSTDRDALIVKYGLVP